MKTYASLSVAAALLACSAASYAQSSPSCEAIQAQIDAKVRASGVTDFSLSVVPADAPAPGRVVGSCDLGTKKIMYVRTGEANARPAAKSGTERIITECKDGSVSVGGSCKP